MKIRKANINTQTGMITDVYLHENRKELRTLVAVPQLEWSTIISYEFFQQQSTFLPSYSPANIDLENNWVQLKFCLIFQG